jgi:hypothetical protein
MSGTNSALLSNSPRLSWSCLICSSAWSLLKRISSTLTLSACQ